MEQITTNLMKVGRRKSEVRSPVSGVGCPLSNVLNLQEYKIGWYTPGIFIIVNSSTHQFINSSFFPYFAYIWEKYDWINGYGL